MTQRWVLPQTARRSRFCETPSTLRNVLWGSPAALGDGTISAANNDTLDGGGGDDLLIVGMGDHSLTGGTGNDTVSFTENGGTEPDPPYADGLGPPSRSHLSRPQASRP